MKISPRTRTLILHDLAVFIAAFVATGILDGGALTLNAVTAAAVVAVKVALRSLLPVPAVAPK